MQMIQFMETVPNWFTAFWKDSLTFPLSHIQVGDSDSESLLHFEQGLKIDICLYYQVVTHASL